MRAAGPSAFPIAPLVSSARFGVCVLPWVTSAYSARRGASRSPAGAVEAFAGMVLGGAQDDAEISPVGQEASWAPESGAPLQELADRQRGDDAVDRDDRGSAGEELITADTVDAGVLLTLGLAQRMAGQFVLVEQVHAGRASLAIAGEQDSSAVPALAVSFASVGGEVEVRDRLPAAHRGDREAHRVAVDTGEDDVDTVQRGPCGLLIEGGVDGEYSSLG